MDGWVTGLRVSEVIPDAGHWLQQQAPELVTQHCCGSRLDREMQQATQLELRNPLRSRALWESVDRQLTDDAVWVPTLTPREVDLTSNRLHNYEYNPVWGFLADQSWLQ
jgi:hypothetical protein